MPLDMTYFRAIQGGTGMSSARDVEIRESKERLQEDLVNSVHYRPDAERNGVPQPLVIVPTDKEQKYTVLTLPNDDLSLGDLILWVERGITYRGLVVDVSTANPFQYTAEMRLCNHLFRWQNWTSDICECWGVIKNPYSRNTSEGKILVEVANQRDFYLPYNDDTKKIGIDKRFITQTTWSNSTHTEIPVCYKVISAESSIDNYGNGRLIRLICDRDVASHSSDSIEEMIADYIAPGETPPTSPVVGLLECKITGSDVIKSGGASRTYTATFYDADGNVVTGVNPVWRVDVDAAYAALVSTVESDGSLVVTVREDDGIVGETIAVNLSGEGGLYIWATKEVEVVGLYG